MTLPGDDPGTNPLEGGRLEVTPETLPMPAAMPAAMPGTLATIGRGLDLNVAASADIRRASVNLGLLSLLSVGPVAALLWAFSDRQGGFEWFQAVARGLRPELVPVGAAFAPLSAIAAFLGFGCLLALTIDAQLLATVLIGARATGRTTNLRAALRLVRLRFWRYVRASFLIGAILLVPRFLVNQIVMDGQSVGTEAQALVSTAIDLIVSTPFAYVAAGIVLGGVGAQESVRRSWRLSKARWRLAFLIGIVNTGVTYIAGFAVGAGGDILVRLGTVFGLGETMGPGQILVLAAIIVLAIASIGSLIMSIAALTVAPQVVAFLGLTGYSAGLNAVRDPDDAVRDPANAVASRRAEPLVSSAMVIALVVTWCATIIAIVLM